MYKVQIVPIIGARDDGYPASQRQLLPEEVDVLIVLTQELRLQVESETIFLCDPSRQSRDNQGKVVYCGAVIDFYLPELDVFIEVRRGGGRIFWKKGQKEPNKLKQQRLARQCGYGFAIVHRLPSYNPMTLRRKVFAAVMQAVADRERAQKRNQDWRDFRALQRVVRRFIVVVRQTG